MVRQKSRKTFEEVYGTKIETTKPPQGYAGKNNTLGQSQRDHGYIITSNTPYQCHNIAPVPAPPSSMNSSRRKSARTYGKPTIVGAANKSFKYAGKEEKEDTSKEQNGSMGKSNRGNGKEDVVMSSRYGHNNTALKTSQYDNKSFRPYSDTVRSKHIVDEGGDNYKQRQHQQHLHCKHGYGNHHDDDKDDDTEEFFQLIRQTVEKAMGKSISELLNRNFRELSSKVERFSVELNNTNEMLKKMQLDLNNKIVHYGEENSRHFRYLCMKSEYDKMFYQHHSMMSATAIVPSPTTPNVTKSNTDTTKSKQQKRKEDDNTPCSCRSNSQSQVKTTDAKILRKSSSEERTLSQKSSDVSVRNAVKYIQRFCKQMQPNEMKDVHRSLDSHKHGEGKTNSGGNTVLDAYDHKLDIHYDDDNDDDDDEDLDSSSDSLTPHGCDTQAIHHQYGGLTARGGNIGAGDGDAL